MINRHCAYCGLFFGHLDATESNRRGVCTDCAESKLGLVQCERCEGYVNIDNIHGIFWEITGDGTKTIKEVCDSCYKYYTEMDDIHSCEICKEEYHSDLLDCDSICYVCNKVCG